MELRAQLPKKKRNLVAFLGFTIILLSWEFITAFGGVPRSILPSPIEVAKSLPYLYEKKNLIANIAYTLKLNMIGYLEAILLAIPIGFLLGLSPWMRAIFRNYMDAARYIPLSAITGIMIAWYGIYDNMKIQFLSLGIFVYLLPAVVNKIDETAEVFIQTAKTLGASKWQIIYKIFFKDVMSRISGDIINLTAIGFTYIVMAEMINDVGGIGAMIWSSGRRGRYEEVFMLLIILVFIGMIWDKILRFIDRLMNRHKYETVKLTFSQRSKHTLSMIKVYFLGLLIAKNVTK